MLYLGQWLLVYQSTVSTVSYPGVTVTQTYSQTVRYSDSQTFIQSDSQRFSLLPRCDMLSQTVTEVQLAKKIYYSIINIVMFMVPGRAASHHFLVGITF